MSDQQPELETETDAATPEDPFSEDRQSDKATTSDGRKDSFRRRVMDYILGYDFFISYAWSDGRRYTKALAKELEEKQERKFNCFVDDKKFVPGENWNQAAKRALKKTRRLILVGSEGATESDAVRSEIEEVFSLGKHIFPIDFKGSLEKSDLLSDPQKKLRDPKQILRIEGDSLETGPSPETIKKIVDGFDVLSVRERSRRWLKGAASLLTVLFISIIGLVFYSYRSDNQGYVDRLFELSTQASPSTGARDASKDELTKHEDESKRYKDELDDLSGRWWITGEIMGRQAGIRADNKNTTLSAKKRADAAITLLHLGDFDKALSYLSTSEQDDPETLAQFAARCKLLRNLPEDTLLKFIDFTHEKENSPETSNLPFYAALIALGEYGVPKSFESTLMDWYQQTDQNAAIHSACGWLLGPDVVAQLNEKIFKKQKPVSPELFEKKWFVVKLEPEAGDEKSNHRVEYITFVVFRDDQHVFAVSDREATVGVCQQLGESGLFDGMVIDEETETVKDIAPVNADPVNSVQLEDAMRICEKLSKRFKTLRAHLPNQSEWASAWGHQEEEPRDFQFGRDEALLERYATFGSPTQLPDQVATHRPSMTGMFDIHGNVGEWALTVTPANKPPSIRALVLSPAPVNSLGRKPKQTGTKTATKIEGKLRGGAAGQPAELCKWIPPNENPGANKGFRFYLSRVVDDG